jgi:hypothetical protein
VGAAEPRVERQQRRRRSSSEMDTRITSSAAVCWPGADVEQSVPGLPARVKAAALARNARLHVSSVASGQAKPQALDNSTF